MPWSISYYSETVEEFVLDLPEGLLAHYLRMTNTMLEFGPNLRMPHSRAMGGGLFELRLRGREGAGRVFFCTTAGQRIVMLHGFIKKTQQTPLQELRIARKRLFGVVGT